MARLDFFAVRDDQVSLIDFLFRETDVRIFDHYSEYDQKLREFFSVREIEAVYELGIDKYATGPCITLMLWSASVMSQLDIIRIELDPKWVEGHTFRYYIDGFGLMELCLSGVYERTITPSGFGNFSEQGARKHGYTEGVNWDALKKLSNKIQYHIRRRLAVAKASSCMVLPAAFELAKASYVLKPHANGDWRFDAVPIIRKRGRAKE
jgi:hypothetical protein